MKLKEIRTAKNLQQKELASTIGVDEPLLSKMENYICLPVPATMDKLTAALECSVNDIYEAEEITFNGKKGKNKEEPKFFRLTVNLPREAKATIKGVLKKCGYKDITYWIYRCYDRLQSQYSIIMSKEKDSITATKQTDGVNKRGKD